MLKWCVVDVPQLPELEEIYGVRLVRTFWSKKHAQWWLWKLRRMHEEQQCCHWGLTHIYVICQAWYVTTEEREGASDEAS